MQDEAVRPQLLKVLLRLLSVNSRPVERFVRDQLNTNRCVTKSHLYIEVGIDSSSLTTRERLLGFLLCLLNDQVEDHPSQSKGAVGLLFILFEDALDPSTTTPDILAATRSLLPTQLAIVSTIFSDHLTRSDDETRILALNKLSRIRAAMPQWPILPWRLIEELLSEQVGVSLLAEAIEVVADVAVKSIERDHDGPRQSHRPWP